MIDGGSSLR